PFFRLHCFFAYVRETDQPKLTRFFRARERQYTTNFLSNVHFCFSRRSNILGSAHIEDKKNGLFFFFAKSFYKCAVPLGRYVPVDRTDVISILVRTHIIK